MTAPDTLASRTAQPAFCIVLEQLDKTPNGHFRPSAFIKLTKAVRTSGLLHALPPEELKSLLTLLSFLTPNGDCSPTLTQLAGAMRLSQAKASARMQRLAKFRFEGEPLVVATTHGNGQQAYALQSRLIPTIEQTPNEPALHEASKSEPIQAVPRQRIIDYSRQRYARTREEVERQIAELNGWDVPGTVPEPTDDAVDQVAADGTTVDEVTADKSATYKSTAVVEPAQPKAESPQRKAVRRRLQNVGIAPDQIESLLSHFELERIEKQLQWLPFRRQARNPSAYLVAAIVGNYEEPLYRR